MDGSILFTIMTEPGIILQARLTSKRFPNKVLCPLLGKPIIQWCIEAIEKTKLPYIIAIPNTMPNRGLVSWLELFYKDREHKATVYEGLEEDLTTRFRDAAIPMNFDPIIRVCGDSPFVDPQDILDVLELYNKRGFKQQINYVQCFGLDELEYAFKNNPFIASREHVVQYMDHTVDFPADIKRLTDDWNNNESPTMKGRKRLWKIE